MRKVLFIIQGEGRGHLTQAIALKSILEQSGKYQVIHSLVGSSSQRELPDYFYNKMEHKVTRIPSPNFVTDKNNKGILVNQSVIYNLLKYKKFFRSLKDIDVFIHRNKPDLIINFYEPLVGLYQIFYKNTVPVISIAHQYIYHHPDFNFPKGYTNDKTAIKSFTDITAHKSKIRLALSFYPLKPIDKRNIVVCPPLLREELFQLEIKNEDFILGYLLNSGYMDKIIEWNKENPDVKIHCFTDKKDMEQEWKYSDTLTFHRLNDVKFLQMMASCKGFISTAGFESVCEAMYLGKPILMVPVEGHFEQFCNSRDAHNAGAGIYSNFFDLSALMDYIPKHKTDPQIFRDWLSGGNELFLNSLEELFTNKVTV